MSGCCSSHNHNENKQNSIKCFHEDHDQKMKLSIPEEQEPRNPLKKLFWKIGKADAEKKMNNSTQAKSCCH